MRYDYRCTSCGEVGEVAHPHDQTTFVVCAACKQPATRYFGPENIFYTQEDRRHMRNGKSHATGQPFAQSRKDERVIEREKGIYFTTKADLSEKEKTFAEHTRYVQAGGTPIAPNVLNPPPDPRVAPGTILKKMIEKNVRFGAR